MKNRSRAQNRGRKIRMVHRVWVMLRFEAEGAVFLVSNTLLADDRPIEPDSGVKLHPGLDGTIIGKHGVAYKKYGALCLETQHYPDSVNHANFPSAILRPGAVFHSQTIYKFSIQ